MAKPFLQKQTNLWKQFAHDKCDSKIHIRIISHLIKNFCVLYYNWLTVSHRSVDDCKQRRIHANYYFNWIFSSFTSYVISFLQEYLAIWSRRDLGNTYRAGKQRRQICSGSYWQRKSYHCTFTQIHKVKNSQTLSFLYVLMGWTIFQSMLLEIC